MDREFIVGEIRRTAEANGGVALGKLRFATETGIKESDWSGKYWARWSDALRDAGYEANEMQGAYPDEYLLEAYACTIQELDRIPTSAELKMRTRADARIPSFNTFARYGSKAQLLGRVHEYCLGRVDLRRVAELTAAYASANKG